MEIWRAQVVAEARSWLGTNFQHQARVKGLGADCAQWISAVYEEVLGWPRQDFGNYPPHWMKHGTEDLYMDHVRRLFEPALFPSGPGDLMVFRFGRFFSHGAIIVAPCASKLAPVVIHADSMGARKVCIEDLRRGPLGKRPCQFWTPKLAL